VEYCPSLVHGLPPRWTVSGEHDRRDVTLPSPPGGADVTPVTPGLSIGKCAPDVRAAAASLSSPAIGIAISTKQHYYFAN